MATKQRYGSQAAAVVSLAATITALILGLWILFSLLDANRANALVDFVHDAARWLAGWSYNLFTMDTEWVRTVLNYGLPAVVYLVVGQALARRLRRF